METHVSVMCLRVAFDSPVMTTCTQGTERQGVLVSSHAHIAEENQRPRTSQISARMSASDCTDTLPDKLLTGGNSFTHSCTAQGRLTNVSDLVYAWNLQNQHETGSLVLMV